VPLFGVSSLLRTFKQGFIELIKIFHASTVAKAMAGQEDAKPQRKDGWLWLVFESFVKTTGISRIKTGTHLRTLGRG
jgi:hypothetical protein